METWAEAQAAMRSSTAAPARATAAKCSATRVMGAPPRAGPIWAAHKSAIRGSARRAEPMLRTHLADLAERADRTQLPAAAREPDPVPVRAPVTATIAPLRAEARPDKPAPRRATAAAAA